MPDDFQPHPQSLPQHTPQSQAVALFRYGLIADLLHQPAGERGLYARLREKAAVQHVIPGRHKLVVTMADPEQRVVLEFNGEPAAEAYAAVARGIPALSGLSYSELGLTGGVARSLAGAGAAPERGVVA